MRITRTQLTSIIREEARRLHEVGEDSWSSGSSGSSGGSGARQIRTHIHNALEELAWALEIMDDVRAPDVDALRATIEELKRIKNSTASW